jgi:hypothetical protein
VGVGGTGVLVGGIGVLVGGIGVDVGGSAVGLGGTGVGGAAVGTAVGNGSEVGAIGAAPAWHPTNSNASTTGANRIALNNARRLPFQTC